MSYDSRKSKRDQILEEMLKKQVPMPVYYDSNRVSIVSDVINAQPNRAVMA